MSLNLRFALSFIDIFIYMSLSIYFYVSDEGSLVPKYTCTTPYEFALYLMFLCDASLTIYIYIIQHGGALNSATW